MKWLTRFAKVGTTVHTAFHYEYGGPSQPWRRSAFAVLPLLVSRHLNGFEFFLIRIFRIVAEAVKRHDPFVEIGKAKTSAR